jgi:predicted DCC family thiol-disulfide oxidoreductase YuxK
MDLEKLVPLVLYDDMCYLCIKFAKFVNFLAKGRLRLVGHYTDLGKKIRDKVLDSSALSMFWFINKNTAYGGRAALLPLFFAIIAAKGNSSVSVQESCDIGCKDTKAVFLRSASLLSNSKKIALRN